MMRMISRLRVDQNRIGVRGQIRIGGYTNDGLPSNLLLQDAKEQIKLAANTWDGLTSKTLFSNTEMLGHGARHYLPGLAEQVDTALFAALLLAIFGIMFGARQLNVTQRHEGLVAAVALETLLKVVAFLMVGIFVAFGLYDGFADLFDKFLTRFPERHQLLMLNTAQIPYPEWFSLTFMAMMAVMFLPRQCHIMVIENCRESHIRDAMWRFPAYLFLITLFVIPIAMAGLLHNNGATGNADFFVLQLPLETGQPLAGAHGP